MQTPAAPSASAVPETDPAAPAFELRGLGRCLPDGRALLEGVHLSVARGGILTIAGPSGAGKSTLIRLLNRLDEPSAGELRVLGRPIADWPVRELRRRVSMVFQEPSLLGLSVRENLTLPFRLQGAMPPDLDARIAEVLVAADLSHDLLERDADGLSVGQKQRVALARGLIARPEVLLLDEPTAALDPATAERLLSGLARLNRSAGLTLVMTSHRFGEVRRLGGRLAVLMGGRLMAEGPVAELLARPPTDEVGAFLQEPGGSNATPQAPVGETRDG
ncbi:MAG TPA: ATP-binding cassette domain-containing protein [bacterium]|nr:ATP-binding cassette domain-containing protein [bacterium]